MRNFIIIILLGFLCLSLSADEGMYPLKEIHRLNLEKHGFKVSSVEIFGKGGRSLYNGIINLSGCTASFISGDGLILTNHHCAFGAISNASTKENNYLYNGFAAADRSREIPAKGYTVRITRSFKDVSARVLKVVKKGMTFEQREKAVKERMKKIVLKAEKKYKGMSAEVAEMFPGKTYVLFMSTILRDIRLVYAPPRSVGEYGGETDNWMWPRHTGDFSLLRAYMSPDGKGNTYSEKNVPYNPDKFLKVNPEGVKEGDLIFILGYPGRTYRNRSSYFINFEENFRMPYEVELSEYLIKTLEDAGRESTETDLKLASRIKSFANRYKNYKGKVKGLGILDIADKRHAGEVALEGKISSSKMLLKYRELLKSLKKFYKNKELVYEREALMRYLPRGVVLFNSLFRAYEYSLQKSLKDSKRRSYYMKRNLRRTLKRVEIGMKNFVEHVDTKVFADFIKRFNSLNPGYRVKYFEQFRGKEQEMVNKIYSETAFKTSGKVMPLFKKKRAFFTTSSDPLIRLVRELYPLWEKQRKYESKEKGELDTLLASYVTIKREALKKDFIPDANSTLRLTWGRVKGYSPKDGVRCLPFTTLRGIYEKNTGKSPFDAPKKLLKLIKSNKTDAFRSDEVKGVPVAMLYDADTTGGNSGSPVLNAKGEVIGLNFDRVIEATINDYQWDESYSRSIGVDIRYILWFLKYYSNSEDLLKEILGK